MTNQFSFNSEIPITEFQTEIQSLSIKWAEQCMELKEKVLKWYVSQLRISLDFVTDGTMRLISNQDGSVEQLWYGNICLGQFVYNWDGKHSTYQYKFVPSELVVDKP